MSRRRKLKAEEKIAIAQACLKGEMSQSEAARRYGINYSSVQEYVLWYKMKGPSIFFDTKHNSYSEELKISAVKDYLAGNGSLREIAAKYGLKAKQQLQNWLKVYNSGRGFKRKISGGSHMKQGRKTTFEERVTITKECLESGNDYGRIAKKYEVSYQQVYTWVKKFKEFGEKGLEDRRGERVKDQDPRTELEKAQIEIERLKHELYMTKMERDLLKKLDEIERRDRYRK